MYSNADIESFVSSVDEDASVEAVDGGSEAEEDKDDIAQTQTHTQIERMSALMKVAILIVTSQN